MNKDILAQALKATSAGMEMAVSILLGCILGYVAGSLFDRTTSYIGMTIGAIIGLAAGIYKLYKKYG
ncbi:MAG: AtpZ/AtpI family protein [Methanotrichaceae archaeon]